MKTIYIPLLIVISMMSFVGSARAQKVEAFIKMFNERNIDQIKKTAVGYISPSLLKHEKEIVRPLVKVTHKEAQEVVEVYLKDILKQVQKKGRVLKGQDLAEHKRMQRRLRISWTESLFIAKEAGVDVVPFSHKVKDADVKFIVVIFSTKEEVVMVKSLGKIGRQIDYEKMQLEGRDVWIAHLKQLKKKIEQDVALDG